MRLFTDASITYNSQYKNLFTTHSYVALEDESNTIIKTESYVSTAENTVSAETKSIMSALDFAEYGSVLYTDSKHNAKVYTTKMKRLIREKKITVKYIPREKNILADYLCSEIRNKELMRRHKIKTPMLPDIREIESKDEITNRFLEILENEIPFNTFSVSLSELLIEQKIKENDVILKYRKPKKIKIKTDKNIFDGLSKEDLVKMYDYYKAMVVRRDWIPFEAFVKFIKRYHWNIPLRKSTLEYATVAFTIVEHNYRELNTNNRFFMLR